MEFIEHHLENQDFTLIKGDLLNQEAIEKACKDIDLVCHVAANPDVRLGASNTKVHLDQNILATYNLLEAMRKNNIKNCIYFHIYSLWGSEHYTHSGRLWPSYPHIPLRCFQNGL